MANKHMKGCSASLVIREGQSKSMRCHLIPARAARIKKTDNAVLVMMRRTWNPHTLPVGMEVDAGTLEKSGSSSKG